MSTPIKNQSTIQAKTEVPFDPKMVKADHQDLKINQLKHELFQEQQNLKDINNLIGQYETMQARYFKLEQEKVTLYKDFQQRLDNDQQINTSLRREMDGVQADISQVQAQIQSVKDQIRNETEVSDLKKLDIDRYLIDIKDEQFNRTKLIAETQELEKQVKAKLEEKKKLLSDLDRDSNKADELNRQNIHLQGVLSETQYLIENCLKNLQSEQDQNELLQKQIKEVKQIIAENETVKLDMLNDIKLMQEDKVSIKAIIEKNKIEEANEAKNVDQIRLKNRALQNKIEQIEKKLQKKDEELGQLKQVNLSIKKENIQLKEDARVIENDSEKNIDVYRELQIINKELHQEFISFNQQNQKARTQLNRQDKINEILAKSEQKVAASNKQLKSIKQKVFE